MRLQLQALPPIPAQQQEIQHSTVIDEIHDVMAVNLNYGAELTQIMKRRNTKPKAE
jgi:hypothetical protein